MKYHFLNLTHQVLNESESKTTILSQSNRIAGTSSTYFENGVGLLEDKLRHNTLYYVIHDVQRYKGKTLVDSGVTVISTKSDIITFITQELRTNDLRPIRIMARINPEFVIIVNDEQSFYLYQ
ncbi:MAG: hypothetical protein GQ574_14095 [Crocinitomix sp.]|nr:hypothetical protein [Crocinitomix sp.]